MKRTYTGHAHRITAFLFAVLLFVIGALSGCKTADGVEKAGERAEVVGFEDTGEPVVLENVYTVTTLGAEELASIPWYTPPLILGDSLYLQARRKSADEWGEAALARFDLEGNFKGCVVLPPTPDFIPLVYLPMLDGSFTILSQGIPDAFLYRVSADGTVLAQSEKVNFFSRTGFCVTEDKILAVDNSFVFVFDHDLTLLAKIPSDSYINVVYEADGAYYTQDSYGALWQIDLTANTLVQVDTVPLEQYNMAVYPAAGAETDYYLSNSDGLYAYTGNTATLLCDWSNSYIAKADMAADVFYVLSPDTFLTRLYDNLSEDNRYVLLRRSTETVEKRAVTIANLQHGNKDMLRTLVDAFNRQSDPYHIRIVDYMDDSASGSGLEQMRRDMLDGKTPELIFYGNGDALTTVEGMAKSGALYDLSGILEKGDILPGIRDSFAASGGTFAFPMAVSYSCIATSSPEALTLDRLEAITAAGKIYFNTDFFDDAYPVMIDSLVNGTECRFDGEEFGRYLRIAKALPSVTSQENLGVVWFMTYDMMDTVLPAKIEAGEIAAVSLVPRSLGMLCEARLLFGDDYHLTGYPTADGGTRWSGRALRQLAIPRGSQNPGGAAAFLAYLLTDTVQTSKIYTSDQLPITSTALRSVCDGQYFYYRFREGGNPGKTDLEASDTVYTSEPTSELDVMMRTMQVEAGYREIILTDEEVEAFITAISGAYVLPAASTFLTELFAEEIEPYLAGERTLENAVAILQKRSAVYLAE